MSVFAKFGSFFCENLMEGILTHCQGHSRCTPERDMRRLWPPQLGAKWWVVGWASLPRVLGSTWLWCSCRATVSWSLCNNSSGMNVLVQARSFLVGITWLPNASRLCGGRAIHTWLIHSRLSPVSSLVPAHWKHSVIFIECLHECETSWSFLFLQD